MAKRELRNGFCGNAVFTCHCSILTHISPPATRSSPVFPLTGSFIAATPQDQKHFKSCRGVSERLLIASQSIGHRISAARPNSVPRKAQPSQLPSEFHSFALIPKSTRNCAAVFRSCISLIRDSNAQIYWYSALPISAGRKPVAEFKDSQRVRDLRPMSLRSADRHWFRVNFSLFLARLGRARTYHHEGN